jgi:hypothetical protein
MHYNLRRLLVLQENIRKRTIAMFRLVIYDQLWRNLRSVEGLAPYHANGEYDLVWRAKNTWRWKY